MREVYARNWVMAISIMITFAIQYVFYPGVMLEFEPTFFSDFSWFVITLVTYHSFWDTVGRHLGGVKVIVPKTNFFGVCMTRFVFVLLYAMMIKYKSGYTFWTSNWFIVTNLTLISVTCGYLSTLGMNYGSDESTVN